LKSEGEVMKPGKGAKGRKKRAEGEAVTAEGRETDGGTHHSKKGGGVN